MKNLFLVISLLLSLISCNNKNEIKEELYLYDVYQKFSSVDTLEKNGGIYLYYQIDDSEYINKTKMISGTPTYVFRHSKEDTFYKKHQSYLQEIEYYDLDWFKNDSIWPSVLDKYESMKNKSDSLEIFFIEPIRGKDSILVRRFHYIIMRGM